jgi:hypothetical protein
MPTVYATAIRRAVEIVGVDEFCRRAKISPSELALCMDRESTADVDIFFATTDIIFNRPLKNELQSDDWIDSAASTQRKRSSS